MAFNGFLLVYECYSTDYLLVSDNVSHEKLFVSHMETNCFARETANFDVPRDVEVPVKEG